EVRAPTTRRGTTAADSTPAPTRVPRIAARRLRVLERKVERVLAGPDPGAAVGRVDGADAEPVITGSASQTVTPSAERRTENVFPSLFPLSVRVHCCDAKAMRRCGSSLALRSRAGARSRTQRPTSGAVTAASRRRVIAVSSPSIEAALSGRSLQRFESV